MPGFSEKPIIIDGQGHLLGRLAALIAKTILHGQKVVVVRCEGINISGSFFRNRVKYQEFLRKRCIANPARGAIHLRFPSKILWRVVRGMVPHKTKRGLAALNRLKTYEGVPPPYDKKKKMVIPAAMRALQLNPRRKYCTVGRLSHEVGWKYQGVIATLEARRKNRAAMYYAAKKKDDKLFAKAKEEVAKKIEAHQKIIANYGKAV